MKFRVDEISSVIREEISHYQSTIDVAEVGRVLEVGDGIARLYGLQNAMASEMVEFQNGAIGQVLNLEEGSVGVAILGDYLGTPVIHQTIKRSTCRGNALLMLESLAPDVERSFPDPAGTYTPRDSAEEYYRGVHDRFERLYGAVVEGS